MNERINALTESASQWWQSITARERTLVVVLSFVVIVGGAYWGVIAPMQAQKLAAEQRLQSEKSLHEWVQDKADQIVALRSERGQTRVSSQPLNQIVSSSVRRYNIDLQRVQPRGDALQVVIAPVEFNKLVQWLEFLHFQYAVQVEFLDLTSSDTEGVAEVKRLQLRK